MLISIKLWGREEGLTDVVNLAKSGRESKSVDTRYSVGTPSLQGKTFGSVLEAEYFGGIETPWLVSLSQSGKQGEDLLERGHTEREEDLEED
jgi:hypothetical protein